MGLGGFLTTPEVPDELLYNSLLFRLKHREGE
jgi:hypothetical protein